MRPFPDVEAGRWQITTSGGTKPIWSRNGRELFFLDEGNRLTVVQVMSMPRLTFGRPTRILETAYSSGDFVHSYDVSNDGQRFLMIKEGATAAPAIQLVLNWLEELKGRTGKR